jgi:hypothetical protein
MKLKRPCGHARPFAPLTTLLSNQLREDMAKIYELSEFIKIEPLQTHDKRKAV